MPKLVVEEQPDFDIDELKSRIDLRALITPSAEIRNDRPTKTLCFWHGDTDPSLHVYPDHVHCFGCGTHMDVLDFVAWQERLDVQKQFKQLVEVLESKYASSVPEPPKRKKSVHGPLSIETARYFHGRLGDRRQWFHERGLMDQTIDMEMLGYDRKAFAIPVWSPDGRLLTVRFRRDDREASDVQGPKYWGMPGRNNALIYNLKALDLVSVWGFVVVCEGELDALRLYQEGVPAISTTNGAGAFDEGMVSEVWQAFPPKVVVAFDQDHAGNANGMRVARLFGLRGRVATWPREWGKDVTEVLQSRRVEDLVRHLFDADMPVLRMSER